MSEFISFAMDLVMKKQNAYLVLARIMLASTFQW